MLNDKMVEELTELLNHEPRLNKATSIELLEELCTRVGVQTKEKSNG